MIWSHQHSTMQIWSKLMSNWCIVNGYQQGKHLHVISCESNPPQRLNDSMDIHVPIQWSKQLIHHLNETWCIERLSEQSHQCQFVSYPRHLFDMLRIKLRNQKVDALYFRLRNAKDGSVKLCWGKPPLSIIRHHNCNLYDQSTNFILLTTFPHTISIDQINEPWTLLKQPYLTSNRIKRISHITHHYNKTNMLFKQSIWFHVIKSFPLNLTCHNCGIVDEYCNASIDNSDVRYYELIIQLYVAYQSIWFIKQKSNQRAIPNQTVHLLVKSFHPDCELISNYRIVDEYQHSWQRASNASLPLSNIQPLDLFAYHICQQISCWVDELINHTNNLCFEYRQWSLLATW